MEAIMRIAFTTLATMSLLTACGGGGAAPAAGTPNAAATYTFIIPKLAAHLVYAERLVDNLNNTVNRTIVDDVTAINIDGSFAMHEEDPSHNRIVSGSVDQTAYPTDFQYNPSAQLTSWVITQAAGTVHCAVTQGSVGAPSPLSVGAGWNTSYTEICGAGAGMTLTQSGSLAGMETITVAAGTFSAFKFVSTVTTTANGITRTETASRWRDASGGDTRTLKTASTYTYSGGTPAAGALVSDSRELQSYR
jgi:hypothetical protein